MRRRSRGDWRLVLSWRLALFGAKLVECSWKSLLVNKHPCKIRGSKGQIQRNSMDTEETNSLREEPRLSHKKRLLTENTLAARNSSRVDRSLPSAFTSFIFGRPPNAKIGQGASYPGSAVLTTFSFHRRSTLFYGCPYGRLWSTAGSATTPPFSCYNIIGPERLCPDTLLV
jgi:hypothetical protein